MKKTVQITTSQLQQIIKEGVAKLHKKSLIENRIKQINNELNEIGFGQYGNPNDSNLEEGDIMGNEEYKILESYLEAALWTEEDEIGHASVNDVSNESRAKANQDVINFMQQAGPLLDGIEPEQVGHDLWLTRNGHGAGFWDRGLGEVGDQLSEIARAMGSKHAYRGDDNLIYIE